MSNNGEEEYRQRALVLRGFWTGVTVATIAWVFFEITWCLFGMGAFR